MSFNNAIEELNDAIGGLRYGLDDKKQKYSSEQVENKIRKIAEYEEAIVILKREGDQGGLYEDFRSQRTRDTRSEGN